MGKLELTYNDFCLISTSLENMLLETRECLLDLRVVSVMSKTEILMAKSVQNHCEELLTKFEKVI